MEIHVCYKLIRGFDDLEKINELEDGAKDVFYRSNK